MTPVSLSEQVFVWASGRRESRYVFVEVTTPSKTIELDQTTFRRFEFSNGEMDIWRREWVEYHERSEDRQGRPDCTDCGGSGTVTARFSSGSTQQACACRGRL